MTTRSDRASEYLDWFHRFWAPVERPEQIGALEKSLGVELPPLLRAALTQGRVSSSGMLHLKVPDRLAVRDGMLAFAHEQQGCHDWGVPVRELDLPEPSLFEDSSGEWKPEGCTLFDFLLFYVALNRVYDSPCTEGPRWVEDETIPALKAGWNPHAIQMRTWRPGVTTYWTLGDTVAILLPDFDDDGDTIELGSLSDDGFAGAVQHLGLADDDED